MNISKNASVVEWSITRTVNPAAIAFEGSNPSRRTTNLYKKPPRFGRGGEVVWTRVRVAIRHPATAQAAALYGRPAWDLDF